MREEKLRQIPFKVTKPKTTNKKPLNTQSTLQGFGGKVLTITACGRFTKTHPVTVGKCITNFMAALARVGH